MKRKELCFIMLNISVYIMLYNLLRIDFFYTPLLVGLVLYLFFYLPFGLEFIISSVFSFFFKLDFNYIVAIFSFIFNYLICLLFPDIFFYDWLYMFPFCINQIVGMKFGSFVRSKNEQIKASKNVKDY